MRIRTGLQTGAALSITVTVVVCLILFMASREVERTVRQSRSAYGVAKNVFEMNLLLNDFLLRHEEKAAAGWQEKHRSLGALLSEPSLAGAGETAPLERLRKSHGSAAALFRELVRGSEEQRRNRDEIISFLDLEEKVVRSLSAESRSMVSDAAALAEESHLKAVLAQQRATALTVVFSVVVTTVLVVVLLAMAAAVVKPITRLREATRIVAGGNLEHRVEIAGRNEIGELSSDFNEMIARLKDSYAGLQNAFNEMSRKLREARREAEDRTRET